MLNIFMSVAETCLLIDSYVNGGTQNSQSAGEEAFLLDPGMHPLNKHHII